MAFSSLSRAAISIFVAFPVAFGDTIVSLTSGIMDISFEFWVSRLVSRVLVDLVELVSN